MYAPHAPPAGAGATAAAGSSSPFSSSSLSLGAPPAPPAAATAAAAAASVGSYSGLPSLAPSQLIPPLVAAYLPSMPPPSVVDNYKQPASLLGSVTVSAVGAGGGAGVGAAAPNGPHAVQTIQLRKRFHVTDGVRVAARKKKQPRTGAAGAEPSLTSSREVPDKLDVSLPGSDMVQKLLALERRLDASIAQKQVLMQHALATPKSTAAYSTPQVIRLFLWHEHSTIPASPAAEEQHQHLHTPSSSYGYGSHHHYQQQHQAAAASADKAETSCWMLKIQGHILEADVRHRLHALHASTRHVQAQARNRGLSSCFALFVWILADFCSPPRTRPRLPSLVA